MSTLRRARPPRSIHRLATALALLLGSPGINAAVEIEYWQYFFEARVTAVDTLIENFEKANPDITVTTNQFPYADYRTKVAAAIPAGEGPDVVQPFYGWLNDYVDAGLITPLPVDRFEPVYGPFVEGRGYAQSTEFVDESAQHQLMTDMVSRIELEGQSVVDSLKVAAEAEQKILGEGFAQ